MRIPDRCGTFNDEIDSCDALAHECRTGATVQPAAKRAGGVGNRLNEYQLCRVAFLSYWTTARRALDIVTLDDALNMQIGNTVQRNVLWRCRPLERRAPFYP